MVRGLTASASLHVALLVWAIVGFGVAKPHQSLNEDPVEVSVISVKDLETRQRKGDVNSKNEEVAAQTKPAPEVAKQEAPKPKPPPPQAAPPPAEEAKPEPAKPQEDTIAKKLAMLPPEKAEPAPKPEPAKPEAKPEPAPDEIALQLAAEEAKKKAAEEEARKKAAEEAKKKAAEEAKRKADEAKKKAAEDAKRKAAEEAKRKAEADAKAKQFDANKIAMLIDKSMDKSGAPPPASEATNPAAKAKGPAAGSPTGKDTVNRAREEDLLKSRIQTALRGCWRVQQPGLPTVTVGWKLRMDGTLEGEPRIVTPVRTPEDAIAARAAIAAVTRCVPFDLPKQNYASWRDIEWDFNPSQMQ